METQTTLKYKTPLPGKGKTPGKDGGKKKK
jgi:hypothetical protein